MNNLVTDFNKTGDDQNGRYEEQTPQAQEDLEEADGQNIQADQEDTHQIESVDEEDPVEETKHDNKSKNERKKTTHSSKGKTGFMRGFSVSLGIE